MFYVLETESNHMFDDSNKQFKIIWQVMTKLSRHGPEAFQIVCV